MLESSIKSYDKGQLKIPNYGDIALQNAWLSKDNKEYDEWYASVDGRERTMDDIRRYHGLEGESAANMLADVDVKAKLKNEEMLNRLDHTKLKTTLTITSEYEPLKEE